jgi:hypothetical protein
MRRTLIGIACAAGALAAAAAVWLAVSASGPARTVWLPLSGADRALLAHVPAGASEIALVPSAAATYRGLKGNPATAELTRAWAERSGWRWIPTLLGQADVVFWRQDRRVGMAASVDGLRAALLRAWILVSGSEELSIDGTTLLAGGNDRPMSAAELDSLLDVAATLPRANALVWQTETASGAFPPIGRPAATAVSLTSDGFVLRCASGAPTGDAADQRPLGGRFPTGAMVSIAFAGAPQFGGEIERLVGIRVRPLLDRGGMLVVYDFDMRKLVPRPLGLLALPDDPAHREALAALVASVESVGKDLVRQTTRLAGSTPVVHREAFGGTMESAESEGELLVSFDGTSMDRYLGGGFEAIPAQPAVWLARLEPSRLAPLVFGADRNPALRFLTPKISRSARGASTWIGYLTGVRRAVSRKITGDRGDQLEVVVTAK